MDNIYNIDEHIGYALLGERLEIKQHSNLIGKLFNIIALPHDFKEKNPYFFSFLFKLTKKAKANLNRWSQEQLLLDDNIFYCIINAEKEAENGQQKVHLFITDTIAPKLQQSFLGLIHNDANVNQSQLAPQNENLALKQDASINKSRLAALSEMSANIGHEINNPLAIALGNLEFLKKELHNDVLLPQKTNHYLHNLEASLKRIQKTISGLKYFAKNEFHEAKSEVNIHELLETTLLLKRAAYAKRGVTLKLTFNQHQKDIFVVGHFGELQQVLMNLISNARDAVIQSQKKEILISTELTSDEINIKITDSGIGISVSEQKKIFNNFYSKQNTLRTGLGLGLGLGLGIVKRILDDHEASISVVSKINEGSNFTITLPIAHSSQKHDTKSKVEQISVSPQISNVNAIIIDDEPMLLEVVTTNLTLLGVNVFATDNFNKVLDEVKTGKYQLLITDMCMPKCDGLQLIEQVKNMSDGKVKCILMTGGLVNGINPKGLSSHHLDGVLEKPFNQSNLVKLLNKLNLNPDNQYVR